MQTDSSSTSVPETKFCTLCACVSTVQVNQRGSHFISFRYTEKKLNISPDSVHTCWCVWAYRKIGASHSTSDDFIIYYKAKSLIRTTQFVVGKSYRIIDAFFSVIVSLMLYLCSTIQQDPIPLRPRIRAGKVCVQAMPLRR